MISIHSPLTGRDQIVSQFSMLSISISIHSPLTGRDIKVVKRQLTSMISIHSPLTGRDLLFRAF